ncbi:acyl carrier protein [Burkholderia sp. BCC1644]|uniref:acyl carrier protein n=1 Tax=Burkholderia sp. BCC1644 TaxID=2676293 RepID=UPI001590AA93|nr:acyl carrier protein [Burkholderia sp. BCC1644]
MSESLQFKEPIRKRLAGLFKDREIGDDDDFFDLGASSLSIVELQVKIEEDFGVTVPTAKLMREPTLAGWTELYRAAAVAAAVVEK